MSTVGQRYNIALLPDDVMLAALCVTYAREQFSVLADGYLLGPRALPHVTLCQFSAEDDAMAQALYAQWKQKATKRTVRLETLYLEPKEAGRFLAAIAVAASSELVALQADCHAHVSQCGATPLTSPESYTPHLTLGLLRERPKILSPLPDRLLADTIAVHAALGRSSATGVFLECMG